MNDWICYTKAMNFSLAYMKDTHFQCILEMLEEKMPYQCHQFSSYRSSK